MMNRTNQFTGRVYRDDPTIMAVDLINEPRCETWAVPDCEMILQEWLTRAAALVKEVAPHQLITVGSEGFFRYTDRVPQAWQKGFPWAYEMGQSFLGNHAVPGVDFAAIHAWPSRWEVRRRKIGVERSRWGAKGAQGGGGDGGKREDLILASPCCSATHPSFCFTTSLFSYLVPYPTPPFYPLSLGQIKDPDRTFTREWTTQHARLAADMNLPLVLEEFGHPIEGLGDPQQICRGGWWDALKSGMVTAGMLTTSYRDHCDFHHPSAGIDASYQLYQATLGRSAAHLTQGGLTGSLFWRMDSRAESEYRPVRHGW